MQPERFFLSMSSGMFHLNDFVPLADYVAVRHRVETIRPYHVSVRVIRLTYYQNRSAESEDNDYQLMYH